MLTPGLQVRYGRDDIVDAWAARDLGELDAIWTPSTNSASTSPSASYACVSAIAIGIGV
ncbi:hypothetical protein [Streptomyces sp. NPDC048639]|uniref:hypothetical protein n=1 Tax=Streptomyces sp. NPDC048639 TaxID=3365581 RepID=UPI003710BD45